MMTNVGRARLRLGFAIAAALTLDLVIDDRPENCLDVTVESKARAILVWRDDKTPLPAAAHRDAGAVPAGEAGVRDGDARGDPRADHALALADRLHHSLRIEPRHRAAEPRGERPQD